MYGGAQSFFGELSFISHLSAMIIRFISYNHSREVTKDAVAIRMMKACGDDMYSKYTLIVVNTRFIKDCFL